MLAVGAPTPAPPAQPRTLPVSSGGMDPSCPSPPRGAGQAQADGARHLYSEELKLRVDTFRKLGYSAGQVQAALLKLGIKAETDAVLGELIRTGAGSQSERDACSLEIPGPALVSRSGGSSSPLQSLEGDRDSGHVLKPIVIDGSNVAMSHGNKEVFSCRGIQLAVDYFLERGHTDITVFVPSWRKQQPRPDVPITDQHILRDLEKKKIVVFTPSRRVGGKRVVCYDDRFIVKLAHETDGIIVSNDTYRDLQGERPEWKRFIEERLLMYSFVNDKFMPPDDPLGRHGPSLDNFLRRKPQVPEQKRQLCPYGKKCTYGMKCKFYHPERVNQSQRSLADELRESAKMSALKDDRKPRKESQLESGHTSSSRSLAEDLERSLCLNHPLSCGKRQQVTENVALFWGGSPWSKSLGKPYSTGVDSSLEHLDSGLGSYDSQHFEGQFSSPQCSSRHCYPPAGSPERYQPCHCCSNMAPPGDIRQYGHESNPAFVAPCHSGYSAYGSHLYKPTGNIYSLPSNLADGRVIQEECWLTQAHSSSSLPSPHQRPRPHPRPSQVIRPQPGAYGDSWGQSHQAAFILERDEVRKKLNAIFNPYQVDRVMSMFPQLLDPQRLAAEILSLKSYGGIP